MSNPISRISKRAREQTRPFVIRYETWIGPRSRVLPRVSVLLAFPAVLLIFGIIVIGFALNGTSSGVYHGRFSSGHDPALIAGQPEGIRSDEWNVGTSWSISQVQQGLPEINETFPGGMDSAIPHDLPRRDWSIAFRPHLVGYLFLDVNHATAWKWWLPALALLAAASMFAVTLLPRRPITAALLSIGFFASPFFQWWFQSTNLWPPTWGLVAITALIWAVRSTSRPARWGWAAAAGYMTVVMAMGIYAPYIIPVVLVVAFVAVALAIRGIRDHRSARPLLRFLPILLAGGVGGVITLIWIRSKQSAVDAFLSTDYPGERLTPTGSGRILSLLQVVGTPFSEYLKRDGGFLGSNSSEASSFFLIGVFLFPVVGWLIIRRARTRARLPWELIGLLAALIVFAAFAFLPGWDAIAHLLFLDRSTVDRTRIGIGLASFAIIPWVVAELDDGSDSRPGRVLALAGAVFFVLPQLALGIALIVHDGASATFHHAPLAGLVTIAAAGSLYLIARRRIAAAALLFLIINVAVTVNVNPIYVGVYDLRTTAASREIVKVNDAAPKTWVGIGSTLPTALLLESGVQAYNGVQGSPSKKMWSEIDPAKKYEYEWNRLGAVTWTAGTGKPVVSNPSPDQIYVTFDACTSFAQRDVGYVVTDQPNVTSPCLSKVASYPLTSGRLTILRVVPER